MEGQHMSKTIVQIIIVSIIAAIIALDIALGLDAIDGNTISAIIWDWCKKTAIVPFPAGLLCGHLFWRR
jgi:hypothetical protein